MGAVSSGPFQPTLIGEKMPHPANDSAVKIVKFKNEKLEIKQKFRMFKFMKALNSEGPIEALSYIFTDESMEKLEEIEMDFADLEELVKLVTESLGAPNPGN